MIAVDSAVAEYQTIARLAQFFANDLGAQRYLRRRLKATYWQFANALVEERAPTRGLSGDEIDAALATLCGSSAP